MPAIGFTEELSEVRRQRAERALFALTNDDEGPRSGADRLAAALDVLADGITDEAATLEQYKKKGWQSTKTSLLATAGKLRDLAKELDTLPAVPSGVRDPKRGIEPGGDPNQPGTAERNPDGFLYRPPTDAQAAGPGVPLPPGADAEATAADLAAERDYQASEHGDGLQLDEPAADETGGIPMLSAADAIAAGLPVVGSPETRAFLAGATDSPGTPLLDTVHGEARAMLEARRESDADPFTDPLPFNNPLASVEPITFGQLMTRTAAPVDLMHWSYSQLSKLDECEVKYAADKIFGKPSLPQWSLVGGRAVHASIDIIERRILAPGSAPENWGTAAEIWATSLQREIDQTVEETRILPQDWRAANGGKENYDWWRVEGEHMVKLYIEQRIAGIEAATRAGISPRRLFSLTANGIEGPVLERELSIAVDGPMGSLEFRAVLDQAWLCADGTLLIVDVKSGRQMPSSFDTFQLGSQAMVLAQHIGLRPPSPFLKACYYDARKGIFTDPIEALARHSWEELVYRMHTAEARRQGGIYRPNVSTRGCTGCGARALCPLMGGR